MAKWIWQPLQALFISFVGNAQSKVLNYSLNEGGMQQYEHFSFRVKDKQRAEVIYSYRADRKEAKVAYAAKARYKISAALRLGLPMAIFFIMLKEKQLAVSDLSGKYNKTFNRE